MSTPHPLGKGSLLFEEGEDVTLAMPVHFWKGRDESNDQTIPFAREGEEGGHDHTKP